MFWTTFEKMFLFPTKFCVGINIFFKFVTAAQKLNKVYLQSISTENLKNMLKLLQVILFVSLIRGQTKIFLKVVLHSFSLKLYLPGIN